MWNTIMYSVVYNIICTYMYSMYKCACMQLASYHDSFLWCGEQNPQICFDVWHGTALWFLNLVASLISSCTCASHGECVTWHRVEKLTEVIAELRHPSSLSQPSSDPLPENTGSPPPSTTPSITATSTTTPVSGVEEMSNQSLATNIVPTRTGEDLGTSCNVSVLELRDDADTLYRCLCIASEMLKELKTRKLSPTLQTLVDNLVSGDSFTWGDLSCLYL